MLFEFHIELLLGSDMEKGNVPNWNQSAPRFNKQADALGWDDGRGKKPFFLFNLASNIGNVPKDKNLKDKDSQVVRAVKLSDGGAVKIDGVKDAPHAIKFEFQPTLGDDFSGDYDCKIC
ncbi:hypothetical protein TSUD_260570 [Trifolium subterraneum]|uniref:Uncharacterized protein n=1 Tax=Trifolium subterraneum TaxID=3900 RepID=A0A2Z6PRV6_TRISU|nr:hypothetical protein TSUD_260570 [Trifolium subterraneum]